MMMKEMCENQRNAKIRRPKEKERSAGTGRGNNNNKIIVSSFITLWFPMNVFGTGGCKVECVSNNNEYVKLYCKLSS